MRGSSFLGSRRVQTSGAPYLLEQKHRNRKVRNSFFMVNMANGMDRGRVRPRTTTLRNSRDLTRIRGRRRGRRQVNVVVFYFGVLVFYFFIYLDLSSVFVSIKTCAY